MLEKIRWFTAEIIIVVAGVLIALALNAWWQRVENRSREQAYLQQLEADLAETEHLITQADSMYQIVDRQGALLVRAFRSKVRPPSDSVARWLAGGFWHEPLAPVTATAEALIFSGDITLIRDDALRAAVTRYVGSMNKAAQRQAIWSGEYYRAVDRLTEEVDIIGAYIRATPLEVVNKVANSAATSPVPPDPVDPDFTFTTVELFRNPKAYRALWLANNWKNNLASTRAEMLAETQDLRRDVQSALGDTPALKVSFGTGRVD